MIEQVKVAVKTDDGGVVIMSIVINDGRNVVAKPTKKYINEQVAKSSQHGWGGKPVSWRKIEDSELPDRYFRSAWEDTGNLGVNMDKARAIQMDHIRNLRDAALFSLDVEYMRADERGDIRRKQEIASRKQMLRDIPETFDMGVATTPEELKNLWPKELL